MTAQKHTPWAVSPHPWPEQVGCCPLVGRPYSISGTDNRNVAAANTLDIARLIAAAPEMLEALKAIVSLGGNLPDSAIENVGGINEGRSRGIMYATARQIATAAIAKAEGRP